MTLSETEMVEKNLELTRRWLHGVLEHPDVLDQLPDEAYLVDLPHDDPDLMEANLQMAAELAWQMSHNGIEKHPNPDKPEPKRRQPPLPKSLHKKQEFRGLGTIVLLP